MESKSTTPTTTTTSSTSSNDDEVVKLNVGGKLFTTYKSTILNYPYTMLARMFSTSSSIPTKNKQNEGLTYQILLKAVQVENIFWIEIQLSLISFWNFTEQNKS
jgi:BTB/POZ domain